MTLSGGLVPDLFKALTENASFLLSYNTKVHFYKLTAFHITRALFYIFQANKAKLKELESSRIGKLSRKKLKVSRDKILENAILTMEHYGYKKVYFHKFS